MRAAHWLLELLASLLYGLHDTVDDWLDWLDVVVHGPVVVE